MIRALLLLALAPALTLATPARAEPLSPAMAPALVAGLIDAKPGDAPFDLSAERGHVVVVHLWASWCPPCRAEMPLLDRFARSHGEVRVIGLAFDKPRDLPMLRAMTADMRFPSILAARARVNGFGTPAQLPQTLVLDAEGRIVARFGGGHPMLSEAALAQAVARAASALRPGPEMTRGQPPHRAVGP